MPTMLESYTHPPGGLRLSGSVAAAVVVLHALAMSWALLARPQAMAPAETALMVTMIAAPEQAEQAPAPPTPRIEKTPPVLAANRQMESAPAAPVLPAEPLAVPVTEMVPPPVVSAVPAPVAEAPVVTTPPNVRAAYANNPHPAYPASSRKMGEQGVSRLRVLVSPEGRVQQLELERSSGYARLDAAAMATVRDWKFAPARQGDATVAAWVLVPINWKLEK